MTELANSLLQGLLIGGLYALIAAGLGLVFGVMRIVNLAHGDIVIAAAFVGTSLSGAFGMPLPWLLILAPVILAAFGYVLQRALLSRVLGPDILPPLLVTFGLSMVLQNALLEAFSADSRKLQIPELESQSIEVATGLSIGVYPLAVFAVAVMVIAALKAVLDHTPIGRAFRATADDPDVAAGMGVDTRHVFALAMALALAVAGIAGVLLAAWTSFTPLTGPSRLLLAFEVVVIGGLGSIWGILLGGIVMGLAQALGGYVDPGWQTLAGHIAFLIVLLVRPSGLIARGAP